jgi:hypothetical protein
MAGVEFPKGEALGLLAYKKEEKLKTSSSCQIENRTEFYP